MREGVPQRIEKSVEGQYLNIIGEIEDFSEKDPLFQISFLKHKLTELAPEDDQEKVNKNWDLINEVSRQIGIIEEKHRHEFRMRELQAA